jgi:Cu(I)/Ag(I) efflux system membrane protein CusA/SilA
VLELGEAEYVDDIRKILLARTDAGVSMPSRRREARPSRTGNAPRHRRARRRRQSGRRRVVMRSANNALKTIAVVKGRLEAVQASLPEGEIVPVYDRSGLIERAGREHGLEGEPRRYRHHLNQGTRTTIRCR